MLYVVLSPRCLSRLLFFCLKYHSVQNEVCLITEHACVDGSRLRHAGTAEVPQFSGNERQWSQIQLFPLLSVCVRFQMIS